MSAREPAFAKGKLCVWHFWWLLILICLPPGLARSSANLPWPTYQALRSHKVLDVEGTELLQMIASSLGGFDQIDVWTSSHMSSNSVAIVHRIRVTASQFSALERANIFPNPKITVHIPDLRAHALQSIDAIRSSRFRDSKRMFSTRSLDGSYDGSADWFSTFPTLSEVNDFLTSVANLYPDFTTLFTIGTSIQGQLIRGLIINVSAPFNVLTQPKIDLVINGGQHAREWTSITTACYIIHALASNINSSSDFADKLRAFRIHIIPVVNVDGFQYTWDTDRYWRKNLRDGYGVDLNRNWGYMWGLDSGSSDMPYSDTYRGTAPFSEPEISSLRDYISSLSNVIGHLDIHSFGGLILRPWGYSNATTSDDSSLAQLASLMADAILNTHENTYTSETSYTLYPVSGGMIDWIYNNLTTTTPTVLPYSFTIELIGNDFVVPASEILPTGEEIFAAVTTLMTYIAQPNNTVRIPPTTTTSTGDSDRTATSTDSLSTSTTATTAANALSTADSTTTDLLSAMSTGAGSSTTNTSLTTTTTTYATVDSGNVLQTTFTLDEPSVTSATSRTPLSTSTSTTWSATFTSTEQTTSTASQSGLVTSRGSSTERQMSGGSTSVTTSSNLLGNGAPQRTALESTIAWIVLVLFLVVFV